jgi:hypothetical protein
MFGSSPPFCDRQDSIGVHLLFEAVGEGSTGCFGVGPRVDFGVETVCGESGSEGSFFGCHDLDPPTQPFRQTLNPVSATLSETLSTPVPGLVRSLSCGARDFFCGRGVIVA